MEGVAYYKQISQNVGTVFCQISRRWKSDFPYLSRWENLTPPHTTEEFLSEFAKMLSGEKEGNFLAKILLYFLMAG